MALVTYQELKTGLGLITLNDPDNLNAMGEEMAGEFSALIDRLSASAHGPKIIILTGAGRAFSAGGNLEMLENKTKLSAEENRTRMLKFYDSFLKILKLNIPLIAAINGHAIGAGLCVASACDIRIAGDKAKLGFTFTRLGLHPGMGATYFLAKVVGYPTALELMLSGRVIDALSAHKIGLVSQVVQNESVLRAAQTLADEIFESGPLAVSQLLGSMRAGPSSLEAALEREAACQSVNYAGSEFAEGVRAAIEKRKPNFQVG